ncbi:hypothetical protein ASG99_07680 [Bacillus sp. Soil768D1]|nr:hypothetical protein ASG99_07680 [Bacillus sp. Soil768D1]
MDTKKNSINQLTVMIFLTIITQVFILMKNAIVASKFGISADLDAFNFANSISSFIYSFIGAGISTILMPSLADKDKKTSINIFITIIYSMALLLLLILLVFRESIVTVLSGSNNSYFITVCSNILIATLIAGFLNSIVGLVNGVLEYKGQFIRLRFVTLFTSVLICIILLIEKNMSIYYYATVVLTTTLVNVIMNLYFLSRSGFKFKVDFEIRDRDFRVMTRLFIPIVLSQGVYQIALIIDTMIASRLGVGQVSILSYSNTIISMVNVLILSNITAFMYPKLIRSYKDNNSQQILSNYIIYINVLMCLFVVLFFTIGKEGISLLYERGNFTNENTKVVYVCALLYILSLPSNAIRDLIYKYFYINNDTLTPFHNSLMISLLNILISIILSKYIGLYGVVLGTTIASFMSIALITIRFKKKFGVKFDRNKFVKENIKIFLITVLSILLVLIFKKMLFISNIFMNIIIYGFLAIGIFVILLVISKSKVLDLRK